MILCLYHVVMLSITANNSLVGDEVRRTDGWTMVAASGDPPGE